MSKKETSPALIAVAVVVALAVLGGLYWRFLGPGSPSATKSAVASPHSDVIGPPRPGENRPMPTGTGRNTITGETLPGR